MNSIMQNRSSSLLIMFLLIALCGALIVFIGLPTWGNIKDVIMERDELTIKADDLENSLVNLTRLAGDREINRTYAQKLERLIPKTDPTESLVLLVESLEAKIGFTGNSVEVRAATAKESSTRTPLPSDVLATKLSLEATGDFSKIGNLLANLKDNEPLLVLTQITLTGRSDGILITHIEGLAYSKPNQTSTESSQTFRIDAEKRNAYLTNPAPSDFATLITTGRPNPFAAL